MFRPDLVDVWVFRRDVRGALEILLMRRAPGRVLPGLWQGVSGSVEGDERIARAALRELREETGFADAGLEAFYDLDLVNQFHWSPSDAIVTAAVFGARVASDAEPTLSVEHDRYRWVAPAEARELVVWPAHREAIATIERELVDDAREPWFRLLADGSRLID